MHKADIEFVYDMVEQLDQSIRKLTLDEQEISAKLGQQRTEELREYWQQELNEEDAQELKTTFDYWDKMLIVTWAHRQRAHTTRATVGQTLMKASNNPND
ncbi:MAG: hypothetical protein RQ733_00670 [Methyloprofundus sp.]|nr:hypothetical protein [Methyloprofundus sp.]MDT8424466.1 hypothetical protein [Methyloprofundus sp.]